MPPGRFEGNRTFDLMKIVSDNLIRQARMALQAHHPPSKRDMIVALRKLYFAFAISKDIRVRNMISCIEDQFKNG